MVSIKVSFCKTRPAISITSWAIVDGRIIFLPATTNRNLPVGCYFDKVVDLAVIPNDEHLTGHMVHFEGASTVLLSQGREVKYNYKTTSFMIK